MQSNGRHFNPLRFVELQTTVISNKTIIAEMAYFRAQRRGFEPGHELEDWAAAEADFKTRHGYAIARAPVARSFEIRRETELSAS
jgi:hypothetical protein